MSRRYDARTILTGFVGETIHTLTGRPRRVRASDGDDVRVATSHSPAGRLVPIA